MHEAIIWTYNHSQKGWEPLGKIYMTLPSQSAIQGRLEKGILRNYFEHGNEKSCHILSRYDPNNL